MCLKSGNSNRIRKIEAAHVFVSLNTQQRVSVLLCDLSRQSRRLTTKDQRVARSIVSRQIVLGCKSGEQPKSLRRNLLAKIFPVFDSLPRQMLPVIQTSSPKRLFCDFKSQWLHEPKFRLKRHASTPYVTSVGRYLWLVQNDMEGRFVAHGGETVYEVNMRKI